MGVLGTVASNILRLACTTNGEMMIAVPNIVMYNTIITVHGLVMVFWFIMPTLFGTFGNIIFPQTLGVSDVSYPQLNLASLMLLFVSIALVIYAVVQDNVQGAGWTMYAPLSVTSGILSFMGILAVVLALIIVGNSSTLTSFNFVVTLALQKTMGYTYANTSPLMIAFAVTGLLLLLVLPVLLVLLLGVLSDVFINTSLFDSTFGGDPLLFQHLFWIFGHPEVYIIILPAFGLVSMTLSLAGFVYGTHSMALAILGIAILGSLVWAHHMFAATLSAETKAYFTVVPYDNVLSPIGLRVPAGYHHLYPYMEVG